MKKIMEFNKELDNIIPTCQDDLNLNLDVNTVGQEYLKDFQQCAQHLYEEKLEMCRQQSEILLDLTWEKLNTGYWKDVSLEWRYAYTYLTLFKAVSTLSLEQWNSELMQSVIKTCDLGLLMGAPVLNNILSRLITKLVKIESALHIKGSSDRKSSENDKLKHLLSKSKASSEEVATHKRLKVYQKPDIPTTCLVKEVECPSVESFCVNFYDKLCPVIIKNAVNYWPAFGERKWSLEYIKTVAGTRTVPIELGSKYTEDSWSQKLMTLRDFIETYIEGYPGNVGYLAQHQLFDQIPELKRDISIPTYCCLSEEEDVDINAWFGPAGTVSPLHQDPKHNFLVQVVGEKYIILYDEKYTENVYPHTEGLMTNTSQVDVELPDHEEFPLLKAAKYQACVLQPGDMLYIPPRCWHYVRSLSLSFSVSFWWH